MESMEERVWQRVFAGPGEQQRLDLRPLLREAAETAAVYRRLMRDTAGKSREKLRRLYEEETANIACLRGMAVLSGSDAGKAAVLPEGNEPAAKALFKCYHRSRRALAEYTARSAEPEFGAVFRRMADREMALCGLVAELLGELGK